MAQSMVISDFAAFAAQELAGSVAGPYHLPNLDINIRVAALNIPVHTACRAPGSVKGGFVMNTVLAHVAHATRLPLMAVMEANHYREGPSIMPSARSEPEEGHFPQMWRELKTRVDWAALGIADASARFAVRDLLAHTTNGTASGLVAATVSPHGVAVLLLDPTV